MKTTFISPAASMQAWASSAAFRLIRTASLPEFLAAATQSISLEESSPAYRDSMPTPFSSAAASTSPSRRPRNSSLVERTYAISYLFSEPLSDASAAGAALPEDPEELPPQPASSVSAIAALMIADKICFFITILLSSASIMPPLLIRKA